MTAWIGLRFRRVILLLLGVAVVIGIGVGVVAKPTPVRVQHYAANGNFDSKNRFLPGSVGFTMADVSSVSQMNSLPPGDAALAWIGFCGGADAAFIASVRPYIGNPKLYGFYLMDDPDPRKVLVATKSASPCKASNLKAEADWIHANVAGAKTFVTLMNMATARTPSYANTYDVANTHIDFFGVSPYPCRTELHGCDYEMINRYVAAVEAAGVPRSRLVPIYQAFGGGSWVDDGGGYYTLPTIAEEKQILTRWKKLVARPAFDFAYSWGSQRKDVTLESAPALQAVFRQHNHAPWSQDAVGE